MEQRWYNLSPEQLEEKLNTDLTSGLSETAAQTKLRRSGGNGVFIMPETSFFSYLRGVANDITVYLLIATAIIAAIFSQKVSAVVIIVLLVLNFSAALLTYAKSRGVLGDMGRYAAPMSRVVRGGRLAAIRQSRLVEGDVILLGAGDIVPADARVITSDGLRVLEVNLTGETRPCLKDPKQIFGLSVPPEQQSDMVFATTVVAEGNGRAVICNTGGDTLAAILGKQPEIVSHDKLRILATLKRYCTTWSLAMLGMILVITALDLVTGLASRGLFDVFITGLSLAVAAMSEMYVVFGYYIIGCGLYGTLKKRGSVNTGAAIKNVERLEEIKNITALVVPRRGGFFADGASVERLWCSDTLHRINERRLYNYCGRLLKYGLLSVGYHGGNHAVLDDPASDGAAICAAAESIGLDRGILASDYPCLDRTQIIVGETPCDLTLVAGDDGAVSLARGDAVRMLEKCSTFIDEEKIKKLTDRDRRHITEAIRESQDEGYKTVGVISRPSESFLAGSVDADARDWNFEGFIAVLEPMLRGAKETIAACREAGIQVILLSEEPSDQNRLYAKRLGIIGDDGESSPEIMTSKELSGIGDDLFRANLPLYHLYEGLTVSQKRLLIGHLRESGEVVGVLGRELDDIILLKDADVGFSCGVTLANGTSSLDLGMNDTPVYLRNAKENPGGCEALKFVCDVLVSPPDRPRGGFNAMVAAISSAKVIYQNLMRMVKYLITSQTARFFIVFYSVIAHSLGAYHENVRMFTSTQLLFSGLIIDFFAVIAIAFQRSPAGILRETENTEERLERPLLHNFKPMFFGLFWAVLIVAVPVVQRAFGAAPEGAHVTTMIFFSFILSQLTVACETLNERTLFTRRLRVNRALATLFALVALFIGALMMIPSFGALFDVVRLNLWEWLAVIVVPLVMTGVYELYKLIMKR